MGFDAADLMNKDLVRWKTQQADLREDLCAKDKIEAHVFDLYRNNAFIRGLIEKKVDALVGPRVRLQAMPDHLSLGVSKEEAQEWSRDAERLFHEYAYSPENWISANRTMDFNQIVRSAARYYVMTGEIMCSREWRTSPLQFNTCFNLISPSRVKQPQNPRRRTIAGIEIDSFGSPLAYHIEVTRPASTRVFDARQTRRIARRNSFNFLQFFHIFEPIMAEYPRGISECAASIIRSKNLDRFEEADLDKAIVASDYAMVITSDETPESISDMLSGAREHAENPFAVKDNIPELPDEVKSKKKQIHDQIIGDRFIETHKGQLMHLFKGEDAKVLSPQPNIGTTADYARSHKQAIANAMGIGYEYATGDFSGVNFAAGQLSMGVNDYGTNITRRMYIHKFCRLIYRSWLDEAVTSGILRPLGNQPYFPNKEAYSRCEFSGSRRIHVDPVKRARAQMMDLDAGVTSRTDICEQEGTDFDSITENRGQEALKLLKAVESAASREGLTITDEQKSKILIDAIATSTLEIPQDMEIENAEQ